MSPGSSRGRSRSMARASPPAGAGPPPAPKAREHPAVTRTTSLSAGGIATSVFRRVLIANRGEIAIRVARTCHAMGIEPVGVYSEADVRSLHRRFMHDDTLIRLAPPSESYLSLDKNVGAPKAMKCEAGPPRDGVLAENADFVRRCEEDALTFL